jgi:hypothetical protein
MAMSLESSTPCPDGQLPWHGFIIIRLIQGGILVVILLYAGFELFLS